MGDPRRLKKKYKTPRHPWQKDRIEKEKELLKVYGLKNKKEIWKAMSKLKRITRQAKTIIGLPPEKKEAEAKKLLEKLDKYNLIDKNSKIEDVLNLTVEDILNRRLQTQVYKQGLARTIKQARQFIVHGHIFVSGQKIDMPSYMVKKDDIIEFDPKSSLSNPEHPERLGKDIKAVKEEMENIAETGSPAPQQESAAEITPAETKES